MRGFVNPHIPVGGVTLWGLTMGIALLAAVGCGDGGGASAPTTTLADPSTTTSSTTTTTTLPERPASTTTTAFDPTSVEGEVEAAYLRSWDVYADAVYNLELDEQALAEVYAGDHLMTKVNEIGRRVGEERAALVRVDHDYTIQFPDESTAVIIDRYRNHQVLIDSVTKDPIEDDPDETVTTVVTLEVDAGTWRVTRIEELQ